MNEKISPWADLLLAFWVVFVCVIYFGGYFWPDVIGMKTNQAAVVYTLMLVISTGVLAKNYLSKPRSSSCELDNQITDMPVANLDTEA